MTSAQGMTVAGSYSPSQLREGELHDGCNNSLIENAVVRIIGNGREKENKRQTHRCCLLHANRKWGMVVTGSYSSCGLRIRRNRDTCYQNPIGVSSHWAVVVALKMRKEHSLNLHAWYLGYHLYGYCGCSDNFHTFRCDIFDLNT
jgi:hypothetical protein